MSVDEDMAGSGAAGAAASEAAAECGSGEVALDAAGEQQQEPPPQQVAAAGGSDGSDSEWDDEEAATQVAAAEPLLELAASEDEAAGGGEEGQGATDSEPEEEENEAPPQLLTHIYNNCSPLNQLICADAFREELALQAAKRRRCSPSAGPVAPPRCSNCGSRFAAAASLVVKPKVKYAADAAVQLCCSSCAQPQTVACLGSSRKGLVEGDVIWWRCCGGDAGGGEQQGGALQYGRIAGFHFGQGRARHEDSWHVQLLSPALSLPSGLYRIHDASAFRLTASHTDLRLVQFARAWQHGKAGVVRSPRLLFSAQLPEVLDVPPDCPRACSNPRCSCHGCACLNPWAAHSGATRCGSSGPARHFKCSSGPAEGPVLEEGGAACRVGGERYAVGGLAFFVPPGVELEGRQALDVELELGRIEELRLGMGESQDSQVFGALDARVLVSYRRHRRSSSQGRYVYTPVAGPEGLVSCGAERLHGLVDGLRLTGLGAQLDPPCGWRDEGGSAAGSSGGGAGSGWEDSGHAKPAGSSCGVDPRRRQERAQGATGARPSGQRAPRVEYCDAFHGLGALSHGAEAGARQAGLQAETRWGFDTFSSASQTFAASHPRACALQEDACRFLEGVRKGEPGYPQRGCPPGVVRVLVGGPPCQGFSGASKSEASKRQAKNILVFLFLSLLEALDWPYAIMENVAGLLRAGDTAQRVLQWAASAGYQCRLAVLQAGSFGVGQHRRRTIFLFAKQGLPLPRFPQPLTLFPAAGGRNCSRQERFSAACSGVPIAFRCAVQVPAPAPLPALTARDVLGDLPAEAAAAGERVPYASAPHSCYAAAMRAGAGEAAAGAEVSNHCTLNLDPDVRDRIRHIPREGGPLGRGALAEEQQCQPFYPARAGNWWDLPRALLPNSLASCLERKLQGVYARLLWCSQFATLLTDPSVYSHSTSTILHPEADRPLTVREYARVQGVPDAVAFAGTTAEAYKQVGNCVPPPLAAALGRELGRAILQAAEAGLL